MAPSAIDDSAMQIDSDEPTYSPPTTYPVRENKFDKPMEDQSGGREVASQQPADSVAIVIDNGSSTVRAGWSFEKQPRLAIPPIMAKFRDRKLGKTFSLAGTDCYFDTTSRSHIRNAFEAGTGIVSNWDAMEHVLDYVFIKLGMNGVEEGIDRPIVLTEAVANFPYSRKSMTEIVFECYHAPSLSYGIDSLFSYNYNQGKTGVVISSSYTSTHVIPVYNSKAMLSQAMRLNWGGWHSAEYLLKLMKLKYPAFPGKLNASQAEFMVRDHCYVSTDYSEELRTYLEWSGLEDRERIIQYPFTEEVIVQKSEEELARIAERKKESGRRLQEQAAKMRLEKLIRKEEELNYYKNLQRRISEQTNKKEVKRLLDVDELRDEAALEKKVRELEKAIKKARQKDVGGDEVADEAEVPVFDLLDVPDDQLDESGLKTKRHQRLLKSNHEARARAKAEKEAEKARVEEEKRADEERREKDPAGWIAGRRQQLEATLARIKDRERMRADLSNRKSLASQMRMKSIANLASDNPSKKRRRAGQGDDDDNFGANDDDWGVYRQIQVGNDEDGDGGGGGSDDEEGGGGGGGGIDDLLSTLRGLEGELLRYDAAFSREDTWDAQHNWDKSLLHAFARGPRPFDEGSSAQAHQLVLNVERIRVPEVAFQPSIAGVDQAGLADIVGTMLRQRLAYPLVGELSSLSSPPAEEPGPLLRDQLLRDVFLTGGSTLFRGFDERLRAELTLHLPAGAPLGVRRARDPLLDAWRGAAAWVGTDAWRLAQVTREEYLEKGAEYLKEHDLGNASTL